MTCFAIVAAAGSGRRMGQKEKKQFLSLNGRPLLVHTLERLASWDGFSGIIVVAPPLDVERVRGIVEGAGIRRVLAVVAGGGERQESVLLGLQALRQHAVKADSHTLVFVHDGARPFPPVERFAELAQAAKPDGALLALACRDTLKREARGTCEHTLSRDGIWLAQTPQVFPLGVLEESLAAASNRQYQGTDEAGLVEMLGRHPKLIAGSIHNFKVTLPEDLQLAEAVVSVAEGTPFPKRVENLAVGHGYDVHRLVKGRKLILGGVEIPHRMGLLGHSDADVLSHAIADACLGAAGLGDIGRWFPDSDPQWEGADSVHLLGRIRELVNEREFQVLRVDATLVAQRPKVSPHIPTMEANLCAALGLSAGKVTVKATTTESLGFEGREEGISAHAVALLWGGAC